MAGPQDNPRQGKPAPCGKLTLREAQSPPLARSTGCLPAARRPGLDWKAGFCLGLAKGKEPAMPTSHSTLLGFFSFLFLLLFSATPAGSVFGFCTALVMPAG